ncbi:hypothetical protein KVR01_003464 [Diaporthe batatas]|uniref:uncharacterized protein n=1 Tax=Diaporthe batatas TaxID=748121 RepID=UPI001D035E68|nr:uncharacterized protein KVR01_003464 [Diaporthe batatas]KAG8167775.1 hypothetical protein KVR01_003464 [Diaporthe batatas]
MSTPNVQNLKDQNAAYAQGFTHGHLELPPAKKYLVVTCMDARIDPAAAFGISLGDAHVVRNAGGSARDALRSIIISQQLLGTREIILVKHTGCGMLTFANNHAHGLVADRLGPTAAAEIASLDFLPFTSLDHAVHDDIDFLKKQSAVPTHVDISGWVYDVETGKARQLV